MGTITPESGQQEEEEEGDQGRVAMGTEYTYVNYVVIYSLGYG